MNLDTTFLQRFAEHAQVSEPTVVQRQDVPEAIRRVSAMARPDYVDLFTVAARGAVEKSPERWARAAVEDTAGLGGQFVWRVACGLRLESRPAPDRVGGWKVADRGDRWLRLEAVSWFMTAHLVVMVDDEQVSVATFIHYDRLVGGVIWPTLAVAHRALMPGLLRGTAARVRRLRHGHSDEVSRPPAGIATQRGATQS
jgi:hypothetical protein